MSHTIAGGRAALAVAALMLAAPALAQQKGGAGPWSVGSGTSVGQGRMAFQVVAGWPGLVATGQYGLSEQLDVGGRVGFSYGLDGAVGSGGSVIPGLRLQGLARFELLSSGALTLGVEAAPGLFFNFWPGYLEPGLLLPVSLVVGFSAGEALSFRGVVDVPAYLLLGSFRRFLLPILFGGGGEYRVDRSLALTFDLRLGPALDLTSSGAARLVINTAVGVAYRL